MNKQESQLIVDRLRGQVNALEINTYLINNWNKAKLSAYSEIVDDAKHEYLSVVSFHLFVTYDLNVDLGQELSERFLKVTLEYNKAVKDI